MQLRQFVLVGAVALMPAAGAVTGAQPKQGIDQLGWMAGCWTSVAAGERRVEEHWMKPAGGTMLGMSRTIQGDRTTGFEFMQIRQNGAGVVYIAKPSGQPEAAFTLTSATGTEARFENPDHDFPQRIIYRLNQDGSLHARVEGTRNGQVRGVDFPMKRGGC